MGERNLVLTLRGNKLRVLGNKMLGKILAPMKVKQQEVAEK
jgi:hypothetical protein